MSTQTVETPGTGVARKEKYLIPAVNIRETKDAWVLEADLPGVNKTGIEVSVKDNELTLIGRRFNEVSGGEQVHRESVEADYRRVFDLDQRVDAGKISAKIAQGVLTLTLPKSESLKTRKIEISD